MSETSGNQAPVQLDLERVILWLESEESTADCEEDVRQADELYELMNRPCSPDILNLRTTI